MERAAEVGVNAGEMGLVGADASSFAIVVIISCIFCHRCRIGLSPGASPSEEGPFCGPGWERGLAVK